MHEMSAHVLWVHTALTALLCSAGNAGQSSTQHAQGSVSQYRTATLPGGKLDWMRLPAKDMDDKLLKAVPQSAASVPVQSWLEIGAFEA